ncbi:MAG: hypothetical protein IPM57_05330 [Oligoflexia bacterium]|nr:hypothetical protein [Oligoflexia bacterium]
MSSFFCKELLPAFIEKDLDKNRAEAIENYLDKDQKLKQEYQKLKTQVEYLEEISRVTPNPELVKFILNQETNVQELINKYKWSRWSPASQWVVQLAVVGMFLVATVQIFPWLNLARSLKSTEIAFLTKQSQQEEDVLKIGTRVVYGPFWPKDMASPENYAKQVEENKIKNAQIADIVAKTDETHNLQGDEQEEVVVKQEGFVWRGVLHVPELNNDIATKISNHIVSLGGAKAGQVELGWVKGDTRYFHFTLPIDKYTEFQSFMVEQGKLILKKEKHPRVMKEGTMRIIMSVEGQR